MTIYTIRDKVKETQPDNHFFDSDTMRYWGQTMKSFGVVPQSDGRVKVFAPWRHDNMNGLTIRFYNPWRHDNMNGLTIRFYNPQTGKLELA